MPATVRKRAKPLGALKNDRWATLPDAGDRYRLLDEIGRGGEATVSLAIDTHLRRQVAIKSLLIGQHKSDLAVQRFLREGMLTARLHHPGIVPIHDIGVLNGALFFAMERVDGLTLREILREAKEKPAEWPRRRLLRIMERVCEIVAFAHSKGVAHRDVKPENIMVEEFDQIYVMDWGIAKDFNADDETPASVTCKLAVNEGDLNLTQPGQAKGTPNYMSPEQAMGMVKRIGYQSDVFAIGIILYEIVTGTHPFAKETVRETLAAIKAAEFPPITDSKEFASICGKALAQAPNARYDNAKLLHADVQRAIDLQPISARRSTIYDHVTKYARRKPLAAGLLAVVMVLSSLLVGGRMHEVRDVQRLVDAGQAQIVAMRTSQRAILEAERASLDPTLLWKDCRQATLAVQATVNEAITRRASAVPDDVRQALAESWLLRLKVGMDSGDFADAFKTLQTYRGLPAKVHGAMAMTDDDRAAFRALRTQLLGLRVTYLIDSCLAACEQRLDAGGLAAAIEHLKLLDAVRNHPSVTWNGVFDVRYQALIDSLLARLANGPGLPKDVVGIVVEGVVSGLESMLEEGEFQRAQARLARLDNLTASNALPAWNKEHLNRIARCRATLKVGA